MRSRFIGLGLFVFLLLGAVEIYPAHPTPVQAQGTYWEDGCIAEVVDQIAATTDVIDYRAACEVYRLCDPSGEGDPLCQFSAFQTMVEQCPPDDGQCHDGAILFAAAMVAYDLPSGEAMDYMPAQTILDGVPAGLAAFWQGDDAAALAQYQLTSTDDHYLDIAMPLSRAVLQQRLNQPEAALAEYDTIFGFVFTDPLTHYTRSQFYAELGQLDEASWDVAALATFAIEIPAFEAFVTALQAEYPMDESIFQDWLYYPVYSMGQYVVTEVHDSSLAAPHPIQVGVYEEKVVAIGLRNWSNDSRSASVGILQILRREDDSDTYTLQYPAYWDNSGSIRVTQVEENAFSGFEEVSFFEGYGAAEFMIAPADAPDPRLLYSDRRHCEGGVLSRVAIGSLVTSIAYTGEYPLQITDVPGGEIIAEVTEPHQGYVTVIGGPECVGNDSVTWWEGYHSDGTRGWFAENIDTLYNIDPTTHIRDNLICNGAVPTLPMRLSVNTTALVVPDLGANNVRRAPSVEAELLGSIPPNSEFEIIGGPVCRDGVVWWYADYDGVVGWTAEGEAPDYWLAPVE